jgi:DnaJ central domain
MTSFLSCSAAGAASRGRSRERMWCTASASHSRSSTWAPTGPLLRHQNTSMLLACSCSDRADDTYAFAVRRQAWCLHFQQPPSGMCRKLSLKRPAKCNTCEGTGTKSKQRFKCANCNGGGVETIVRQVGPGMVTQMQRPCSRCRGKGTSIPASALPAFRRSMCMYVCTCYTVHVGYKRASCCDRDLRKLRRLAHLHPSC